MSYLTNISCIAVKYNFSDYAFLTEIMIIKMYSKTFLIRDKKKLYKITRILKALSGFTNRLHVGYKERPRGT
jgi:hypothetical protein